MNERIKLLANQALDQAVSETWTTLTCEQLGRFQEKFAELIVKECIGIVEQYGTPDAFYIVDEINRVMLNIRPNKHFGVGE